MEERIENHIFTERNEPRRRIIRSDGALYVVLLILVFGIILLGNRLSAQFALSRFYVQLAMYVLLLGGGYWVYRTQLIAFRCMLTDRMLTIIRLVGRKERTEAHIHLSDVTSIRPFDAANTAALGKLHRLYAGGAATHTAVTYREGGQAHTLLITLTPENVGKLIEAWKKSLK